jgi:hypothetical protein
MADGQWLMADGCLKFCEETFLNHFKCISSFAILLVAQHSEQLVLFVVSPAVPRQLFAILLVAQLLDQLALFTVNMQLLHRPVAHI